MWGICKENERLFLRFDAVLLRRYEVKESLSATVQFVEFAITGLTIALPTTLVKNSKKEGPVVKGAVFDRII